MLSSLLLVNQFQFHVQEPANTSTKMNKQGHYWLVLKKLKMFALRRVRLMIL